MTVQEKLTRLRILMQLKSLNLHATHLSISPKVAVVTISLTNNLKNAMKSKQKIRRI